MSDMRSPILRWNIVATKGGEAPPGSDLANVVGHLRLRPDELGIDLIIDEESLGAYLLRDGAYMLKGRLPTPEAVASVGTKIEQMLRQQHFAFTAGGLTPDGLYMDAGRTFEPWDPEGIPALSEDLSRFGLRLAPANEQSGSPDRQPKRRWLRWLGRSDRPP